VLFIAINGVKYTASNGNPGKQMEAKNGLVSAAIGLAIASANLVVQPVVAHYADGHERTGRASPSPPTSRWRIPSRGV
jgi:hypothetical protein